VSFSRVNGGGWSANDLLDKDLLNELDLDHSNAWDKTGDTITGTVTVGAGSQLVIAAASDGVTCNGDITITGAGAQLITSSSGRITLGDNDYPRFSAARTREVWAGVRNLGAASATGTWTGTESSALGFYYTPDATGRRIQWMIPDRLLHQGATLSSVSVWFEAAAGHVALPSSTDRPSLQVFRYGPHTSGSAAASLVHLRADAEAYLTMPATTGDYNSKTHKVSYTCTQNNVIDKSQYLYSVRFYDELGSNAVIGSRVFMISLAYSSISDMRFQ